MPTLFSRFKLTQGQPKAHGRRRSFNKLVSAGSKRTHTDDRLYIIRHAVNLILASIIRLINSSWYLLLSVQVRFELGLNETCEEHNNLKQSTDNMDL